MGDNITFAPNTGINPTFVGQGSVLQHPDILPIFRGSYWPIGGDLTSNDIMKQLYLLAGGSYFQGLIQYGYVGPAQVRNAIIDNSPLNIPLPTPAPGVSQTAVVDNAVRAYVKFLVENNRIDNVDDNHDLIVLVFLDPVIPFLVDTDNQGNQLPLVFGANTPTEIFELLDDNIRFMYAWITTASGSLATVTQTFSHELAEAISDPFNNGWSQTLPPPAAGAGQIGDVCNPSGITGGVSVASYWSVADNACIVPTPGIRRLSLSQTLAQPTPFDGPTQTGFVDFPLICGGGQDFDFVERTYRNELTIHAAFDGYEAPVVNYTINGQTVPILQGEVEVDATWDIPRSNPFFPDFNFKPQTARLITRRSGPMSSEIIISVGPHEGNISLKIVVTVSETFDDPNAGGGTTRRSAFLDIDVVNQEIIWGSGHDVAVKNCDHLKHIKDGPNQVFGPPHPEDPFGMVEIVMRAVRDQSVSRADNLLSAANLVETARPDVSKALMALAKRMEIS